MRSLNPRLLNPSLLNSCFTAGKVALRAYPFSLSNYEREITAIKSLPNSDLEEVPQAEQEE